VKSILLVIKENRYSFSPIITISDFYSFNIEIIELKEGNSNINYSDNDLLLYNFIEKQLEKYKNIFDDKKELNVLFFSVHSWYRKFFLLVFSILKKNYPNCLFIAGGPDVIAKPYLYADYFDLVCRSEGEPFLIDFFDSITNNKKLSNIEIYPENISNCVSIYSSLRISIINDEFYLQRGNKDKLNFNKLNLANSSVSINRLNLYKDFLIEFYHKFSSKLELTETTLNDLSIKIDRIKSNNYIFSYFPSFPLITSFFHPIEVIRGCPQGCKYCQVSNIFGKKYRKKNIEIVKIFLKYQLNNKKNHIRFISPDFALFFMNNEKDDSNLSIIELIDYIKIEAHKNSIEPFIYLGSFPSELSLRFLKPEFLNLISKFSVTKKITIGIQTASLRLQKIIGRNDPLDKLDEILDYCLRINLNPIIDIIFGLPFENEDDRDCTFEFLERRCSSKITANLHYFLPLPGSEFENETPAKLNKNEILRIQKIMGRGFVAGNLFRQMNEYFKRIEIPIQYLQNL